MATKKKALDDTTWTLQRHALYQDRVQSKLRGMPFTWRTNFKHVFHLQKIPLEFLVIFDIALNVFYLQRLRLEFAIAFVVITDIDALHIKAAVVDFYGQRLFEQEFDFQVFYRAALHG